MGSPVCSQPAAASMAASTPSGVRPGRSVTWNSRLLMEAVSSASGMPPARMPSTPARTAPAKRAARASSVPFSTSSSTGCCTDPSKPTSMSAPRSWSSRYFFRGDWLVDSSASSRMLTAVCFSISSKRPVYQPRAHCTGTLSGVSVAYATRFLTPACGYCSGVRGRGAPFGIPDR